MDTPNQYLELAQQADAIAEVAVSSTLREYWRQNAAHLRKMAEESQEAKTV